jgi:RNA recognition motif-containing protein
MNIYISNLNYSVNDNELNELFAAFGTVTSAKVITDKFSGKSRGFGFVEMSDDNEANHAIEELNETDFKGKTIGVSVAKPRTDKPKRDFGNNRGGGNSGGGYGGDRRNTKRW